LRIGFSNALFFSLFLLRGDSNTARDGCVSVIEGGARRLSFDSAAENRPSWSPPAGCPSSIAFGEEDQAAAAIA
jgi:hypothetical protein